MRHSALACLAMIMLLVATFGLPTTVFAMSTLERVLFEDDFESVEAGSTIQAKVGQWTGRGALGATVTNDAESGPASKTSKQWVVMQRANNGRSQAWFTKDISPAESADKIVARFSTFCESESKQISKTYSAYSFGMGTTLAGVLNVQASRGGSGTFCAMSDGKTIDTKVPYKAKAWQAWELTVEPAKGTYSFSVDGIKSPTLQLGSNTDGGGDQIVQMEIEPGIYGPKLDIMATLSIDDLSIIGNFSERALIKDEVRRELVAEQGKVEHPYNEMGKPLNLGHRMQLFLDPSSYADRWDARAVPNTPIKSTRNPVVEPDQLWEHSLGLPNVLYEKETQTFHMWYANYDTGTWAGRRGSRKPGAPPT
jgi:hypothetical protein